MHHIFPKFYSQCGEDKVIFHRYFKNKYGGVFLELGALDGVTYSNTKFFEDTMRWSGVLIEPIPVAYEKLKSIRRRSKCYNNIISRQVGTMDIYVNGAVSSVKEFTTEDFFNGWHKDKNAELIKIQCRRLDDILHESNITRIDFWSLDVEGSEYEVLQTMDWNIPVYVVCMETNGGELSNMNEKCRELLRSNGFIFDGALAHNELWVNPKNTS